MKDILENGEWYKAEDDDPRVYGPCEDCDTGDGPVYHVLGDFEKEFIAEKS